MRDLLSHLAAQEREEEALHPLLMRREPRQHHGGADNARQGPDRRLHSKINRAAAQFIVEQQASTRLITIGRKGRDFMVRAGQDVQAVFTIWATVLLCSTYARAGILTRGLR